MALQSARKRKLENGAPTGSSKPSKKPRRKQQHYSSPSASSSSEPDFAPVSLADSDDDTSLASAPRVSSPSPSAGSAASHSSSHSPSSASRSSSSDRTSSKADRKPKKRNDPAAFSAAIHKILSSKLSTSKRADPVLARSASAQEASTTLANARLEAKAKQKLREEKKASLEKGRVKDVLLGSDMPKASSDGTGGTGGIVEGEEYVTGGGMTAGELQEQEKRLRKTAQRGVVKLFNAVRAAQVRGEEAARKARGGRAAREERVREMGREGFLELIATGGGGKRDGGAQKMAQGIEEA